MKKKIIICIISVLFIVSACSSQNSSEKTSNDVKVEKKVEEKVTEKSNKKEDVPKVITLEDFNNKFKLDPDETQYKNGKFQLSDGSIVNADYFSYGENELFDYATAIFYKGELAHIQIETSKSKEEIEKELGITFNNGNTAEKNKIGYEINFNETFLDTNINVFPNEWD